MLNDTHRHSLERDDSSCSAADRRPGDYLRAMAALFLRMNPKQSRESLAKKLQRRLDSEGVDYHRRTLRRQLSGEVTTVPRSVESAMQAILLRSNGFPDEEGIEDALQSAGLAVARSTRFPEHVNVKRLVAPTRLWLYLHPGNSKRSLAHKLSRGLARRDIRVSPERLQASLAGKGCHVRREVLRQLVACLSESGITSEADALAHYESDQIAIEEALAGRHLTDAEHFSQLADLWWAHSSGASKRSLAKRLQAALAEQGIAASLDHLQAIANGKKRVVQQRVVDALEVIVREQLPFGKNLETALDDLATNPEGLANLQWVSAGPLVRMARRFLREHPEMSRRRLAMRLAETVRDMGYRTSYNTVQAILGGGTKKTRRYMRRALQDHLEAG